MRRLFRYSLWVLPLLLSACVPAVRMKGDASLLAAQHAREQALAPVDRWVLQGRLGVSNGSDGGSGSFSWSQDGDHYEFVLRAPVTGKSFRLSGDNHGALMEGLDGGPIRGRDAESLMHRALGWDVPLSDLRAWVLGLRADSGPAELTFGEDRLPATLLQDGWSVDYREWDTNRQPPLPKKLYAAKPPYKVKLVIESWQLP
ncbi:MAG TPA: lipoprotein insertase outer membrane protein LolB [Rhodanobacter sp.]|nr:lipoprotein insertase outer membrane protein LolB [Rhodanobacter sp.]